MQQRKNECVTHATGIWVDSSANDGYVHKGQCRPAVNTVSPDATDEKARWWLRLHWRSAPSVLSTAAPARALRELDAMHELVFNTDRPTRSETSSADSAGRLCDRRDIISNCIASRLQARVPFSPVLPARRPVTTRWAARSRSIPASKARIKWRGEHGRAQPTPCDS